MKKLNFSVTAILLCWFCINLAGCNFSNRGNDSIVSLEGEYICVSLKNYFGEFAKMVRARKPIPEDFNQVFGISWIDGYIIDEENKDVVLVGKCIENRPGYQMEDLIVSFQNVFDSINAPYCSLDPYPENVLKFEECFNSEHDDFEALAELCREAIGGQKVVVGGVPRNSRHARVMIYADYEMKKLSQGLITDSAIVSCLELSISDSLKRSNRNDQGSLMSRFWFHIKKSTDGNTYPNYLENDGIVFIRECPVVLLTESQCMDESGNLKDDEEQEDIIAELFAKDFSDKFDDLKERFELFALLENTFRLQAFFKAMKFKRAFEEAGLNLAYISSLTLQEGNELPDDLPGLINYRIIENTARNDTYEIRESRLALVAGGVDQQLEVTSNSFLALAVLGKCKENLLADRGGPETIYWNALHL